jgi:hypothetical protein
MRYGVWSRLAKFFSGDIRQRTLLFVLFPLVVVSYFGVLALAVMLFPGAYDWCTMSISKLLYPRLNPQFHYIAAIGIAVTGLLMIPFAGYIHRRSRTVSPIAAAVAAALFIGGCICLIFAGLVSSHPLHGGSPVPRLHEQLARAAAIGIGVGSIVFDACVIKGYFNPATTAKRYRRSLVISWNLLVLPAILVLALRLVMFARLASLDPFYRAWRGSVAWHLGFWEWVGSAAVILFLLCSAWLLPEHTND